MRPWRAMRTRSCGPAPALPIGVSLDGDVHVEEIWRYPVKSLRGEQLAATELLPVGHPRATGSSTSRRRTGA